MKYKGDEPINMVINIISCINGYCIAIGVAIKNMTVGLITLVTLSDKTFKIGKADAAALTPLLAKISEVDEGFLWW